MSKDNPVTVLATGAEYAKGEKDGFLPWWRDKRRLLQRLVEMVRNGDNDTDDLILASIVERARRDRYFRQKLKGNLKEIRAGKRGNPETPASFLKAIYLHVEGERTILNRSQKEAFASVGRCHNLSEHTIEKHYLAGKKLIDTAK